MIAAGWCMMVLLMCKQTRRYDWHTQLKYVYGLFLWWHMAVVLTLAWCSADIRTAFGPAWDAMVAISKTTQAASGRGTSRRAREAGGATGSGGDSSQPKLAQAGPLASQAPNDPSRGSLQRFPTRSPWLLALDQALPLAVPAVILQWCP